MIFTSVSGHLLSSDFSGTYRGWSSCDPVELFSAPLAKFVPETYDDIRKTLEREVRSCQKLVIWTDCDREGENIGFEIIQVCKEVKPNIDIYRAKFSEMTAGAIQRAIRSLERPNENVSDAVDARIELDLRIGQNFFLKKISDYLIFSMKKVILYFFSFYYMNLSLIFCKGAAFTRFQTRRLQKAFAQLGENLISYGSCQFPTLGFVVERYKDRENFVSEPFWKLAVTHQEDNQTVEFNWDRIRLFDYRVSLAYFNMCKANPQAKVTEVVTKPKSKWRPLPLDTIV
jgi:DNA topoisomerase-3